MFFSFQVSPNEISGCCDTASSSGYSDNFKIKFQNFAISMLSLQHK